MEVVLTEEQKQTHADTEKAFGKAPGAPATPAAPVDKIPAEKPEEQKQPDPATPLAEATAAQEPKELTDEEFDALLEKRTKGKVKKLSDLDEPAPVKTPEQIEAEKKEKKKNSLAWAIQNELINQDDYDRSIVVGSKTEREIALDLFAIDAKEVDPDLTSDEIEERFKDHYREDLDETDPLRKLAMKKMSKDVASYKNEINGKVSGVESNYDNYLTQAQSIKNFNKQVNASLKDELPKSIEFEFSYPGPDGKDLTVKMPFAIDEAIVESVRKEYINNEAVYSALKGNKKEISNADIIAAAMYNIKANLWDKAIPELMKKAATQGAKDWEADRRAIPDRRAPLQEAPAARNEKAEAQKFHEDTNKAFNNPYRN